MSEKMRWIRLVGKKLSDRHDVWPSEIRVKIRGRRRIILMKLIRDRLPPRFRERFRKHLEEVMRR